MFMIIVKTLIYVYPFIRELILGKYSDNKEFRNLKLIFIFIALTSIAINVYLLKSSIVLSKQNIEYKNKLKFINTQSKDPLNITDHNFPIPDLPEKENKDPVILRRTNEEKQTTLEKLLKQIDDL